MIPTVLASFLIGIYTLAIVATVTSIGKERKTVTTPKQAAVCVVAYVALIALLVIGMVRG